MSARRLHPDDVERIAAAVVARLRVAGAGSPAPKEVPLTKAARDVLAVARGEG